MRTSFLSCAVLGSQFCLRTISVLDSARGCCISRMWTYSLKLTPTAAFDHDFGAVTGSDDPLIKSYRHLM